MRNGSAGFMQFFGRPLIDELQFGKIIEVRTCHDEANGAVILISRQFLHGELIEWQYVHTKSRTVRSLT